ncbi:MAG: MaoC family dehydratase [Candidatus Dormibacteria bacterium]
MRVFDTLDDVRMAAGTELGVSDWHAVTQEQIDAFAQATGDHQWIHVDAARAAGGPFGTTIAHGFLSLALTPMLVREIYSVQGVRLAINYGANRVRFPAPLPSNSEVRARARLETADDVPGGLQVVTHVEIEVRGAEKPCCVADLVSRLLS